MAKSSTRTRSHPEKLLCPTQAVIDKRHLINGIPERAEGNCNKEKKKKIQLIDRRTYRDSGRVKFSSASRQQQQHMPATLQNSQHIWRLHFLVFFVFSAFFSSVCFIIYVTKYDSYRLYICMSWSRFHRRGGDNLEQLCSSFRFRYCSGICQDPRGIHMPLTESETRVIADYFQAACMRGNHPPPGTYRDSEKIYLPDQEKGRYLRNQLLQLC